MRELEILRVSAAPEVDPPEYYPNFRYLCQLDPEGSSADVWSLGFFVRPHSSASSIGTDHIIVCRSGSS
jgi:hypothetical protein